MYAAAENMWKLFAIFHRYCFGFEISYVDYEILEIFKRANGVLRQPAQPDIRKGSLYRDHSITKTTKLSLFALEGDD